MAKWKVFAAGDDAPESEGDPQPLRVPISKVQKNARSNLSIPTDDAERHFKGIFSPTMIIKILLWDKTS